MERARKGRKLVFFERRNFVAAKSKEMFRGIL
jgi:hypothetical protein